MQQKTGPVIAPVIGERYYIAWEGRCDEPEFWIDSLEQKLFLECGRVFYSKLSAKTRIDDSIFWKIYNKHKLMIDVVNASLGAVYAHLVKPECDTEAQRKAASDMVIFSSTIIENVLFATTDPHVVIENSIKKLGK